MTMSATEQIISTTARQTACPAAGESRGWFYVLETEVSVDMQVRWGTLGAAPGLRDLVMNGLSLYVSTPGQDNDRHNTLAGLDS